MTSALISSPVIQRRCYHKCWQMAVTPTIRRRCLMQQQCLYSTLLPVVMKTILTMSQCVLSAVLQRTALPNWWPQPVSSLSSLSAALKREHKGRSATHRFPIPVANACDSTDTENDTIELAQSKFMFESPASTPLRSQRYGLRQRPRQRQI